MFKLKFKTLLLLLIFVCQNAVADKGDPDYWYYSNAEVKTVPTGAGKVYAGTQTNAANPNNCVPAPHVFDGKSHKSNFPYQWYLNTIPTDSKKYKFLRWEDAEGNLLSPDQNPNKSFKDSEGVKGTGTNTGTNGEATTNPGTVTIRFIAVYEEIINQYVSVESQDATYLTATIDKPENQIGDEVTLWAYPNNYNSKFTGWSKNGEIVSMENPWTFTIDESNSGTYIATYKTGYNFFRFRNKETSRRFNAISDQGSLTNFSSLQLVSGEVATYSPGSVVEISTHHISGGEVFDYIMQNAHTSAYYNESAGQYITMSLNSADNTWNIYPNRQNAYMADDGDVSVSVSSYKDLDKSKWYIEPMDKDLETKENYFSLDPEKLVQVGDKYYTTLRTSWNILFNPEQMTPYVVTSVDETEGTFEMAPITGNIIPAGTPVIIKTRSNVIEENRMVPTKTAAASGAVPAGNLLQVSTKYFPNQSAPVSNCKQLMVNANGELAFGGNALSTVNGNEAYLQVSSEVALKPDYKEVTLAELVKDGEVGQKYIVTDLTAMIPFDGDRQFLCKDNNGFAEKDDYSKRPEGVEADKWIDYMQQQTDLKVPETYDQSNWIALRLPKDGKFDINMGRAQLSNVKGRLLNKVNPELLLDVMPTYQETGTGDPMPVNTFVAASFAGTNRQQGTNDKWYFFVQPKPMELATVEWAQWNGTMFTAPIHDENHPHWNEAGLQGAFEYDDSYAVTKPDKLNERHIYRMGRAIAKLKSGISEPAGAPRRAEGTAVKYVVYPLSLEQTSKTGDNDIITEVTHVVGREVTAVDYYNLAGQRSERPWQGINIVVTRYSDGTTQASKVLR